MSTQAEQARPGDTKERILDSAEKLFADAGFDGTSLRGITAGAGVNLAAVHYYFGSKEALVQAVLARRLEPINRRRIDCHRGLREFRIDRHRSSTCGFITW